MGNGRIAREGVVTMSHRTSFSRKSEQAHWRRMREQRDADESVRRVQRREQERFRSRGQGQASKLRRVDE